MERGGAASRRDGDSSLRRRPDQRLGGQEGAADGGWGGDQRQPARDRVRGGGGEPGTTSSDPASRPTFLLEGQHLCILEAQSSMGSC